jgi:N-acetylglutamate synthase-like GNAT family acetyltransferase
MAVHAVRVDWSTHQPQLRQIRERVFIEVHGIARSLEFDGLDDDAAHFVALNEAGIALGTARLLPTGLIGRVAVLPEHRRRGIGRQLLEAAVAHAVELGLTRVFAQARQDTAPFYHRCGFRADGSVEATPRIEMALELPLPYVRSDALGRADIANLPTPPLATRPRRLIIFDSESDCRRAIELLLDDARRTVVLFSPNLEPELFATPRCIERFRQFAHHRRTTLQILVEDARAIAVAAHPLLELARRLPSKVRIRRIPDDHTPSRRHFLVVDGEAVWLRPDRDAYVGWANLHDRVEARRLLEEFGWLFELSTDDPELRLLNL